MASEVTVGIDIGTTSVKAVAVDGDGRVLARPASPTRSRPDTPANWPTMPASPGDDGVLKALDRGDGRTSTCGR